MKKRDYIYILQNDQTLLESVIFYCLCRQWDSH